MIADLVRFGAPDEIAVDSRPHVGSNRLPRVLQALREHLVASASTTASRRPSRACASRAGASARSVSPGGDELPADVVVLAVGHSARPVYAWAAPGGDRAGAQADRDRRAHRASATADRRDPVRRRGRAPEAAARLLRADQRGRRSRRLQLLHVPGRLDRPGGDGGRRRRRQRHEPVAPRLAVRERRAGRHRRRGRLRTGRRPGRSPASSCSARSSRRRFARAAAASARPAQRLGTSWTGAPAPRSARRATGRGSRRPT